MPDYYEQPDYLKDLYNGPGGPNPQPGQTPPQGLAQNAPQSAQTAPPESEVSDMFSDPNPIYDQNFQPQPLAPKPVEANVVKPGAIPPKDPQKKNESLVKKDNKPLIFIIIGIVIFIILIGILLLLIGRRGGEQQRENVVIQWWGTFIDEEVMRPILDEYTAQNPNVTIEYANRIRSNEPFEDEVVRYQDELNRVLREGNQVEIPDIFMVDARWVGDYERFARTSTTYSTTEFTEAFYGAVSTNFVKNNQVYGAPLWIDNYAVIYNRDMLSSESLNTPPTIWSEFKTAAQRLTRRTGNNMTRAGFAAGTSSNVSFSSDTLMILMLQNGVNLSNQSGVPTFSQNSDSLSALQFYKSFLTDNSAPTWSTNIAANDSSAFLDGEVAMIIAPSYRLREILRFNENNKLGLDIGVAPLPKIDSADVDLNFANYWGNMVALNRPNGDESWRLLEWITQPDQLRKINDGVKEYYSYFGIIYPRADMEEDLAGDEYLRVFNNSARNTRSWYMVKGLEIKDIFDEMINANSASQNIIERAESDIIEAQSTQGML